MCSVNLKVTEKSFNFARKYKLPLYFVSASDGTNVVKVSSVVAFTIFTITYALLVVSVSAGGSRVGDGASGVFGDGVSSAVGGKVAMSLYYVCVHMRLVIFFYDFTN